MSQDPEPPQWPQGAGLTKGPIDPTAKWAVIVAGALGVPLSLFMGLDLLLYGVQYSLCSPDYTCGGLPSHDVYTGWLIGAVGFTGPLCLVMGLSGRGQRVFRWICACAAVACPVLIMVVAAELSQPPL